jgi:hypothetical protein
MSTLDFALRATSEQAFWDSWITAGICTAPNVFTPEYPGISISSQTDQGWVPSQATGVMLTDELGNEYPERIPVSGWHANVRVTGPLVAEMTYGLDQTNPDGTIKSIFDRTWATNVFSLTWQEADPISVFPAGYKNPAGTVSYCDPVDLKSPTNVWA